MKFLKNFIILVFVICVAVACSNDSGVSPVVRRDTVNYGDLRVYCGSPSGAHRVSLNEGTLNIDSLYQVKVRDQFFPGQYSGTLALYGNMTFEFLDDNMLSYLGPISDDKDDPYRIVSSYIYEDGNLFIMKDGEIPVFVARQVEDEYIRIVPLLRHKNEEEEIDEVLSIPKEEMLSLETALKYIGINRPEDFTNDKDTIIWCNVKYIFK